MKLRLLALSALASATLAGSAFAAVPPGSQGNGEIAFSGSVIEAPCGLAPGVDGDNQNISLGQIANAQLKTVGYSKPVEFKITLIGCTFEDSPTDPKVNVRFDGVSVGGANGLLGVTGDAKGIAIRLLDSANQTVKIGTSSSDYTLRSGDNILQFSAQVVALESDGSGIVPGHYDALTNFSLTYL